MEDRGLGIWSLILQVPTALSTRFWRYLLISELVALLLVPHMTIALEMIPEHVALVDGAAFTDKISNTDIYDKAEIFPWFLMLPRLSGTLTSGKPPGKTDTNLRTRVWAQELSLVFSFIDTFLIPS